MARTDDTVATGGSITIGAPVVGGTPNEVLYIDASGDLASSANFQFIDVAGTLSMFFSGNGTFLVDPTNQIYALGGYTGGGIGNFLKIDNTIGLGHNFITLNGSSGRRLLYDGNSNIYKFGDVDSTGGGSLMIIDDTNELMDFFVGGKLHLHVHELDGHYQFGAIGNGNNTFIDINDSAQAILFSKKIDMQSNLISNVLDPVSAQDAATKVYVDSFVTGLSWKGAVAAVTTTALPTYTYNNGAAGVGATITEVGFGALPAIDGVTLSVGNRLLIKDEVGGNAPNNGIYTVQNLGSAGSSFVLVRATDNDTSTEMISATVSSAPNGSVNGNAAFTQSIPAPIVMGATSIVWVNFLNTVYTAGAGLTLTGHAFSLNTSHANDWLAIQSFESGMFKLVGSTSGSVIINAAAITTPYTLFLPSSQGALNETLLNDGSGNLSWGAGGGGGGSGDSDYSFTVAARFLSGN